MRAWVARVLLAMLAMGGGTVTVAAPVEAQAIDETHMLRQAAALESQGDYKGAEQVLRQLLEANPGSSGGLFALERVLRAEGDVVGVLPAVDRFLAHDASAAGVRYLKLRVLVEVDSLDAAEREAEAWIDAEPTSEAPYREIGRIYARALGPKRALAVLQRGRTALARPDAFALEIGDLLAATDDIDGAVSEWAVAVGAGGAQTTAITRRITELGDHRREAGEKLVAALGSSGDAARQRAGAVMALDLGLAGPALDLSRKVAGDLDGRTRIAFLADVARRARSGQLTEVASWAYRELGQDARSPAERRQFDQHLVEMSLADGDTATALQAQRRVVESFTAGSADSRKATVELIKLETRSAEPERLHELLDSFRIGFPKAPEMDEVVATIAGSLLAQGDAEGARGILEEVQGPRSALQRGYLLLDGGQIKGASKALLMALPGMPPAEATEVIQFVSLLGRLSPGSGEVLARAAVLAHDGRGEAAAGVVREALDSIPDKERPSLLAEAARMADRGGAKPTAAELRARLIQTYPDADESSEAMLSLARYRAATPAGVAEAIQLLETLVTERPNAPMVPDARRELERLRRAGA